MFRKRQTPIQRPSLGLCMRLKNKNFLPSPVRSRVVLQTVKKRDFDYTGYAAIHPSRSEGSSSEMIRSSVSSGLETTSRSRAGVARQRVGLVKQTTLGDRIVVDGIGVHSGRPARVILHPADANSGYLFLRTGLAGGRERLIEGRFDSVRQTELCTVIGSECGATVSTVEHLLAALAGLGVDNALIEIDGPELPILDGSSRVFVEAIDQVGVVPQSANRKVVKVLKPVRVEHGRSYAELIPGGNTLSLEVEIAFDTPVIGRQMRTLEVSPARFRSEIAAARTFGFMKDVEKLWKAGFALGASLDNTVAIGEDCVVNPEGLRFADEFVRHKILDAVGDLALAGHMLRGTYRAFCPGHKLNFMMLQQLFSDRSAYAIVDATTSRRDVSRELGHGELSAAAPAYGPNTR